MADIFLSASVTVLFDRLASVELFNIASKVGIGALIKQWNITLSRIKVVLSDAEEKQLTNNAVKMWLADLEDLALDLDDILDDLATEVGQWELISHSQSSTSQVSGLISNVANNFSPSTFMSNYLANSKLDGISTRLQEIFEQKDLLDLKENYNVGGIQSNTTCKRWPSTSVVEPHIYGRKDDKQSIIQLLLRDESNEGRIGMIPILGMAGVGKTTLAKMVYNDEKVDSYFNLKAWACVSNNFDVMEITKEILESLTSQPCNFNYLNTLQVELKQKLAGQKFLLVLDDIWNENSEEWDLLCYPFLAGASGSKIIVTTRIAHVAKMLSHVRPYHLKQLGNDHCLALLAQRSLGTDNFDKHPDLKEIGENILKKCQGLPLAVKTLGGLLRTKPHPNQWEDVLKSELWELSGGILPALRLSYDHLPCHLKHCFAYCAICPKGFAFEKDELILLWMAVGLLPQSKGRKQMEDFGNEYFDDLLSRSFFQKSTSHILRHSPKFVMHDLINDLAKYVAGEIFFKLQNNSVSVEISERVRYSSYISQYWDTFQKFEVFYKFKCLRTFLPFNIHNVFRPRLSSKVLRDLVPNLKCLRVLSLSDYTVMELPNSIGDLKHLRYLNLSRTSIKTLPESVCTLYNLQTLSVHGCQFLCKLPASMGRMINLRHLDNAGTEELREMPSGISKLRNLHTLSKFIVGRVGGLKLRELRDMMFLHGTLSIVELQNVMDIWDAQMAGLRYKQDIDVLRLVWSGNYDESCDENHETGVLEMLQPHGNLKKLTILRYQGTKFPSWIGNPLFSKVTEISLIGCERCTSLPSLGQLANLKFLCIRGMNKVRSVGIEFYKDGNSSNFPFQSLETLIIECMPEWEEWSSLASTSGEICAQFPHLRELSISRCPKLIKIPQFQLPSLCKLVLEECHVAVLKSFSDLTSLITLKINRLMELTCIPEELMQFCVALEILEIVCCREMASLWQNGGNLQCLACLKELTVRFCHQLTSLGEEEQALPCRLEVLNIDECNNLEKIPYGSPLRELSIKKCPKLVFVSELSGLVSLRKLEIIECEKLVSFAEASLPPMLRRLEICSCEVLETLPNFEPGVSRLEELEILGCSSLRWWPMDKSPTTLKKISIEDCRNLQSVMEPQPQNTSKMSISSTEDHLIFGSMHNFTNLLKLHIYGSDGVEYLPERGWPWPATPKLRELGVWGCKNLRSLNTDQIKSLEILELSNCPNLESFFSSDLPSKLASLEVRKCEKLKPLLEWGLDRLSSLRKFIVEGGNSELVSFSKADVDEALLPATLTLLNIGGFPNLVTLSKGLESLTSLTELLISDCPKLKYLPKDVLLPNLSYLYVRNCPLLKQRCLPKDKGEYWPLIADIPQVNIDGCSIHE